MQRLLKPAFSPAADGEQRATAGVMILLVSPLRKVSDLILSMEEATADPVAVCASLGDAITQLQTQKFSAVVFDQMLLDAEPEEAAVAFKHLEAAVPICVNFAVCGKERVLRELRSALERRKREVMQARRGAEDALRHDLKESVTALLLSCELALQVPELPPAAATRMQAVEALARDVSVKLGGEA